MLARFSIKKIRQTRRAFQDFLGARILAVEDAQGITGQTALRILIQLRTVLLKIRHQGRTEFCTLFELAQRVDFQAHRLVQSQLAPQARRQQNQLGINIRPRHTKGFNTKLVELTVAPFLRTLVTEHGAGIPKALRLVIGQAMLQYGTHTARRTFRAQGDGLTTAVLKGIHFLFHNISDFTDGTLEEWRALYDGQADFVIAIGAHEVAQHGLY